MRRPPPSSCRNISIAGSCGTQKPLAASIVDARKAATEDRDSSFLSLRDRARGRRRRRRLPVAALGVGAVQGLRRSGSVRRDSQRHRRQRDRPPPRRRRRRAEHLRVPGRDAPARERPDAEGRRISLQRPDDARRGDRQARARRRLSAADHVPRRPDHRGDGHASSKRKASARPPPSSRPRGIRRRSRSSIRRRPISKAICSPKPTRCRAPRRPRISSRR